MAHRILVVSAVPWNTNNNFGNSYSDIFTGIENIEIANIYLSNGLVNDSRVSRAFEISEDMLIRNLLNGKYIVGKETCILSESTEQKKLDSPIHRMKKFGLNHRFSILYACRDLLWKVGKWKSERLITFIKDFSPEIIFAPINGSTYPNNIIMEISKMYNLPIIGYISDDNYTFQQFSLSPLYWIRRYFIRLSVGKLIKKCRVLYVISQKQKETYDKIFGISSKILTKGFVDKRSFSKEDKISSCINIVYAGNLGLNRWKSIASVAREIDRINNEEIKVKLDIYSGSVLTKKMRRSLKGNGVSFKGRVDSSQIHNIQKRADLLLHVEATDFSHKWGALYGFSTKLVDYFSEGKAILAYGNANQASISYLKDEDAAFVATNERDVENILNYIVSNPIVLNEYAKKSFECGKRNHDVWLFKQMIMHDIENVLETDGKCGLITC